MTFLEGIESFHKTALLEASASINKVVRTYFNKIVEFSPDSGKGEYSVGTIKDNWYVSLGTPSQEFGNTYDDVGASSLFRLYAKLEANPFHAKDNTLYFSNSTPWAYRAEYLGWPAGKDPDSDWIWTNNIKPYAMVRNATAYLQGASL